MRVSENIITPIVHHPPISKAQGYTLAKPRIPHDSYIFENTEKRYHVIDVNIVISLQESCPVSAGVREHVDPQSQPLHHALSSASQAEAAEVGHQEPGNYCCHR